MTTLVHNSTVGTVSVTVIKLELTVNKLYSEVSKHQNRSHVLCSLDEGPMHCLICIEDQNRKHGIYLFLTA